MTAGRERVHLVVLGFLAYVALLALGVYTLALHPPRIQPAPPPPPPPRGGFTPPTAPPRPHPGGEAAPPLGAEREPAPGLRGAGLGPGPGGAGAGPQRLLERGAVLHPDPGALRPSPGGKGPLARARGKPRGLRERRGHGRRGAPPRRGQRPPFDPDAPRKSPEEDISWRNHAFLVPLEPGSTAKTLTAAMLLEEGAATLATRVEAPMRRELEGWTIRDIVPHPPS